MNTENFKFNYKHKHTAGLVRIYIYGFNIHLWINKSHIQYGYEQDWYYGPLHSFGLGKFLLLVW